MVALSSRRPVTYAAVPEEAPRAGPGVCETGPSTASVRWPTLATTALTPSRPAFTRIADPLERREFRIEDGKCVRGRDSLRRAHPVRMMARVVARPGRLLLREGSWRGRRLVPRDWVKASPTSCSDARRNGGYGCMLRVATNGTHLPTARLPEGTGRA